MRTSYLMTASAGAGKTHQLTAVVRELIAGDPSLIVAITFTNAAAAEMEKRILDPIAKEQNTPAEKLKLIMRAAQVRYSTIDSLFHQLLATEEYVPQMADEHEKKIIEKLASEQFFTHPAVVADTERILIAARILNILPEKLTGELDENRDALAAWECPSDLVDELRAKQERIRAAYDKLREEVVRVGAETEGRLKQWVVTPLSKPIDEMPTGTLMLGHTTIDTFGTGKGGIKEEHRRTSVYRRLNEIFPEMRRLLAEYLVNTARLRSALLKHFSELRMETVEAVKRELDRRFFDDVPRELLALDGNDASERPELMARIYERGYHRTAHLLLDEFQDTSAMQMELLKPLLEDIAADIGETGKGERSLFFVGDWKQSIYRWRGADPDRLQRWLAPLLHSGQLRIDRETLKYNRRSTPLLVAFFNNLTRRLFAGTESEKDSQEVPPADERKEPYAGLSSVAVIPVACSGSGDGPLYETLVAEIRQRQAETNCAWGDITVLCRTHGHLAQAAKKLAEPGANGEPSIGTSDLTGRELLSLREGTALYLALAVIFGGGEEFVKRALTELGYHDLIDFVRRLTAETSRRPLPHRFAAVAAAISELAPHFPRSVVETLWNEAELYFDRPDAQDAVDFLRYLRTVGNLVTVPEGEHSDRVKLATMHGAKGLEFPHVFVLWKDGREPGEPVINPEDRCPLKLSKGEVDFLATVSTDEARAIVHAAEERASEKSTETANLLYVAATRAKQSLTILVRANKDGEVKDFGKRMLDAAREPIPGFEKTEFGYRHDYGTASKKPEDREELSPATLPPSAKTSSADEMDPAFRSAEIEAGIERGIRIHAALAKLSPKLDLPQQSDLTDEERKVLARFLRDAAVREILSRPGKVLCEQHLSNRETFGIVDRLIIALDRITLIDYKTGHRTGTLLERYREQMEKYRTMLGALFPGRPVEAFLLFVDDVKNPIERV